MAKNKYRTYLVVCIDIPDFDLHVGEFLHPITRYEFKFGINNYLHSMNNPKIPQSLGEIIEHNKSRADIALKYGQDNLIDVNENTSGTMCEPEYLVALAKRGAAISIFDALFSNNKIDVFFMLAGNSGWAAATGFPCMTIPIGKTSKGLPIGSYFVARQYAENTLFNLTYEIEKAIMSCQNIS